MTARNVNINADAGVDGEAAATRSARRSSTDDARVNRPHEKHVLTDAEKQQMQAIEDKGLEFWQMVGELGVSRELSLAQTKIEEAVFWGVKHVTKGSA